MANYKLLKDGAIKNLSTGEMFSPVSGNSQYEEYLVWLSLGNTPEPADEPTATELAAMVIYAEAVAFDGLPDWAAYTTTEAVAAIHNAIFSGATLATVNAQIDALPVTIAGMKTGLKAVVAEIITIRATMEKMAKAVVYLRDRT